MWFSKKKARKSVEDRLAEMDKSMVEMTQFLVRLYLVQVDIAAGLDVITEKMVTINQNTLTAAHYSETCAVWLEEVMKKHDEEITVTFPN